jgi:DNA-3-methyladenine glycosylase II
LLVELPEPYDFELSLERYRTFGPDHAYLWRDGALYRVLDGHEVRITAAPGGVRIEPPEPSLAEPVRRLLGAPFDLDGFVGLVSNDPALAPLTVRLNGFRPPLVPDAFEQLVTSITAQQVSLRAALAIRNRLIERFGTRGAHAYAFPERDRLASAGPDELTALGLSRRKAQYVLGLARADLEPERLAELSDADVIERLRALDGIGEWTAEWFLARHLGRPDAWPAGDLGLRHAISAFLADGRDVSIADARSLGERFSPHRNLAAHYLLTGMRVFRQ